VFPDDHVFRSGRNAFELHRDSASRVDIVAADSQFREAVRQLQSRLRDEPAFGIYRSVIGLLEQLARAPDSVPAADGLSKLDYLENYNESSNLRKIAQLEAALDANGIRDLADVFAAAGATVEPPKELKYPKGKLLGWSFSFRK
jgi:hypothetical protein